jgi:hypothetical protein
MLRKVIIGAAAMGVAILLFIGYIRLTGTKGIRTSDTSDIPNIPDTGLTDQNRRIDKTTVRSAQQARYTILDPLTKRVRREFGFESLLNPDEQSNNWQVRKPYMNVFESRFRCRMDAEEGAVQVEYSGGNVVPKDARMMGKVVIRLLPTDRKRLSETVILMDDLNYSSERSEFFTDGPVQLISAQSRLLGKGMQMIYNPQNGRIEYFRIKEIESIRIRKVVTGNLLGKSPAEDKPEPAVASDDKLSPEKTQNQPIQVKDPNSLTIPQPKPAEKQQPISDEKLYYECSLRRDVKIRYGKQVIVQGAEEINIRNLLWGSQPVDSSPASSPQTQTETATGQAAAKQNGETTTPTSPAVQNAEPQIADDWNRRTQLPPTPADDDETDVFVTCGGGLIVKPIDSAFDPAKESAVNNPPQGGTAGNAVAAALQVSTPAIEPVRVEEPSGAMRKPAQFEARKLDYDLNTGSAAADGPIRFTFYPSDPNDPNLPLPVIITAQKNTEFLAGVDKKTIQQVVFHKDVIGDATEEKPGEKTIRRFYGDTLTVDLAADPNGRTQISHIAVADGSPKLQAIRYRDGVKINHVELLSKRFDYEQAKRTVVAVGPGRIELNNKQAVVDETTAKKKQSLDLRRPCYALLEGFDTLTWLTAEDKVLADARKDTLNLSYLPMKEETVPDEENLVRMAVSNVELRFGRDAVGKSVLSEIYADNGVYLEQRNKHILIGETLHYTGADGWVHIEGSENRPCLADGARVPVIDYNFLTEKLKFKLSKTPGAISLPQK